MYISMAVKAERIVSFNAPLMMLIVYSCILGISWLGAKMIVQSALTTGELMMPSCLLYEYFNEPYDAFHGICYAFYECGKCRACI